MKPNNNPGLGRTPGKSYVRSRNAFVKNLKEVGGSKSSKWQRKQFQKFMKKQYAEMKRDDANALKKTKAEAKQRKTDTKLQYKMNNAKAEIAKTAIIQGGANLTEGIAGFAGNAIVDKSLNKSNTALVQNISGGMSNPQSGDAGFGDFGKSGREEE